MTARQSSWVVAGAALTAVWVMLAIRGPTGLVSDRALAGAAGAGTAATITAVWGPRRAWGAGPLLLVLAPVAVAGATAGRLSMAAAGAVVVALAAVSDRARPWAVALAAVGVATAVAAVVVAHAGSARWSLTPDESTACAVAVAAAALLLAAAGGGGVLRLLVVPALLAGVVAAPGAVGLTLVIGVAASAAAVARPRLVSPEMGLAAVALAAAAVSTTRPAALLLGAGAVLGLAWPEGTGGLLMVPAVVVMAGAIDARPSPGGLVVAGATGLAALAAARSPRAGELTPEALPAIVMGAWLLLAPGTWRWTGPARLAAYGRGAAAALASAVLVLVAASVWRGRDRFGLRTAAVAPVGSAADAVPAGSPPPTSDALPPH